MLQIIAGVVVVSVAGFLAVVAKKPNTFRFKREQDIKASPEAIYALINDFHNWIQWSPYEKKDPNMKRTYSGSESGKGAVYEWEGNNDVGQGRMEIIDTVPGSKVVIKLDFLKPFEGHNTAEFTMVPQGDSTHVIWAMSGPANFISKVMQTVMDMDKMIGDDFADGLAKMKTVAEA